MKKSIEEKNSIEKIVAFGNWRIKKDKIVGVHMHVSPKNSKKKKNYSKLQIEEMENYLAFRECKTKNCNFKIPWKNSIVTKHYGKCTWHTSGQTATNKWNIKTGRAIGLLDLVCAVEIYYQKKKKKIKRCGLRWQTVIFVNSCNVI